MDVIYLACFLVYPYIYSFTISDKILNSVGLPIIVGSTILRHAIEDLAIGKSVDCNY